MVGGRTRPNPPAGRRRGSARPGPDARRLIGRRRPRIVDGFPNARPDRPYRTCCPFQPIPAPVRT